MTKPNLNRLEVSKSALIHNAKVFKQIIGQSKLIAVVKSNAYGHGAKVVSETLAELVDYLGVASGTEALELRRFGLKIPILVLSYYDEGQLKELLEENITLVIYDHRQVKKISALATGLNKVAKIHLKVETGLSRLGVDAETALSLSRQIKALPHLELEGIFSHFATADDDTTFATHQLNNFLEIIKNLEVASITIPIKHIANTAGCIRLPTSRLDGGRIGIGLYGLADAELIDAFATEGNQKISLRPVMTWKTKIIAIKDLPPKTTIGYGRTYKTERQTKLAILPTGYNEGYGRSLSNLGEVLISGQRCPIRGRICMNLIGVDVTDIGEVATHSEVVLFGRQGKSQITATELARLDKTINYEILTKINPSLPRILVD